MRAVKFIVPSLLGLALFLWPITLGSGTMVLLGHVNRLVKSQLMEVVLVYGAVVAVVTLLGSLAGYVGRAHAWMRHPLTRLWFGASSFELIVRCLGALFYLMIYFEVGPALVISESTGGLLVNTFIGSLYVTFTVGNLILPLLLNFGLLEFIGNLLKPLMRRVFKVPGRSAVDAVASFVGDGTLGLIVTNEQYKNGYYTKREATVIAMSFSVVGIAFASFVAEELGFSTRFGLFYGTIVLTTVVVAVVLARTPFIRRYPDTYFEEAEDGFRESEERVGLREAYEAAVVVAERSSWRVFPQMVPTILHIHLTFIPVIVFVGTCGLIVAEATPLFRWLALPLVPLYELLQIPDAQLVAEATLVGFVDMYLPTLFIQGSESEVARFIVGTLSFTQLIFMAETGSILLRTQMRYSFGEVLGFFLLRTVLSLPVILVMAKLFV